MKKLAPVANGACLFVIIVLSVSWTPAQKRPDAIAEVKAALDAQVAAWNDVATEKPTSVYHDSPEMLWVNRTGIRKGFEPVRAAYRRDSVSRPNIGTYSYEPLHIERLSPSCVYFVIRWKIERNGRSAMNGVTSMVWKRVNKKWVIAAEHAS